jgi:RHS repeat-associated protein
MTDGMDLAEIVTFSTVCFGVSRNSQGTLPTDRLFTGQRLDSTGLYYYNARYYDTEIGKFISPDSIIPNYFNPQFLNRYSYCLNNPLKYTDSTGHFLDWIFDAASIVFDIGQLIAEPSWENGGYLAADIILGIVPFVPAGVGPATKVVKGINKIVEGTNKITKNTLELLKDAKIGKNGHLIVEKKVLNEIGQAESKGIDFSTFKKEVINSRETTVFGEPGGFTQTLKYSDSEGTKFVVHEVYDSQGILIHRDFDSVRIESGQIVDVVK